LLAPKEKQFVQENLGADVTKLLLNPPAIFKDNISFLVDQIVSRRKAKGKLPTWCESSGLIFPSPLSVEQSSSEVLANYKARLVFSKLLIDLTGGMGVDCLAMSTSFDHTIYVETNKHLCDCFEHNSKTLSKSIQIENQTAESFLETADLSSKPVLFIDPDRRSESKKMVRFSDCSPDVSELAKTLKSAATQMLIKASPLLDIKAGLAELINVKEVHVLSIRNECKEVLFLLDFSNTQPEPIIKTVNILAESEEFFEFTFSEEDNAESAFSKPRSYLLIPNASILKAGAFNQIGVQYGIPKIARNTHIYTSDKIIAKFPGRQFKIISDKVRAEKINEYLPNRMVNVITKNHPASPSDLLQKFKLKEGGELYLIGFRDGGNKVRLVIAQKD